jgi:type VI protein secretion system component VasK
MYQPWSFWLAWGIIFAGFVVVALWNRKQRRREHEEWLAQRSLEREAREARIRKMMGR